MDIVELKAVDLRAVDERGVRCGNVLSRSPDRAACARVHLSERPGKNLTPWKGRAVDGATEGIEDEQLDPVDHLARNVLVLEVRHEIRDFLRVLSACL